MFHTTFVQFDVFNWLTGPHPGQIFGKIFKILLLKKRKRDEADTGILT